MMEFKPLISEAEMKNASDGGISTIPLAEFSEWYARNGDAAMLNQSGEAYASPANRIRWGLPKVVVPFVPLGWLASDENPADRAGMLDGVARLNVYNLDDKSRIVNPSVDEAHHLRSTTQDLTTAVRELGSCGDAACWVHPIHRTTTCGCCQPSGCYAETGDIGTAHHRKVCSGLWNTKKTAILGVQFSGTPHARLVIALTRTLGQRSGAGKSGGSKLIAIRYATTCRTEAGGCGRSTCWGVCGTDNHMRFTIVMSQKGRTLVGLDPRRSDYDEVIHLLTQALGGVPPVISDSPFSASA
jgi:hypothetical protein